MGRKSITLRVKTAKTNALRGEILHCWADNWKNEHVSLINRLKRAIDDNNHKEIIISLGELRGVTEKKHRALHNIFDELLTNEE